jgi:hypothetical protein
MPEQLWQMGRQWMPVFLSGDPISIGIEPVATALIDSDVRFAFVAEWTEPANGGKYNDLPRNN